jgi:hypothetical protein
VPKVNNDPIVENSHNLVTLKEDFFPFLHARVETKSSNWNRQNLININDFWEINISLFSNIFHK